MENMNGVNVNENVNENENKVITGVFDAKDDITNTSNVDIDTADHGTTPLDSLKRDAKVGSKVWLAANKKVTVEKFVQGVERLLRTGLTTDQLKKDFAEYVASHVITNYLPYQDKIDLCKSVFKAANYVTRGEGNGAITAFVMNTPAQNMLFDLALVDAYTDIEVRFKKHSLDDYNLLEQYDCIRLIKSSIPDYEMEKLHAVMDMVIDDVFENERSVMGMVLDMKESVRKVFGNFVDGFVDQLKKSGLSWEDVVDMFSQG